MKNDSTKGSLPILEISLIFFTMLPVTMIVPVFKDLIKDKLGGDNLMVALFMSTAMLGSFLFSPLAGYLSDKYKSRKKFIAIFAFLDGLCFLVLPNIDSMLVLQMTRFIEGVCHVFVIGLLLSLMSDRENDAGNVRFFRRGILLGLAGMFLSLGVGLGSPLGILGRKNPSLPFYLAGSLMFAIGILASFRLRDYPFHYQSEKNWRAWWQALRKNRFILLPYAYTFIDRFTVGFLVTSFNLYMRESLDFTAGQVGILLSMVLFPMSLLSYPFARLARKTGPLVLMMVGSAIYGINLGIAGSQTGFLEIAILLIVAGIGAGVMFVPSMILASKLAPPGYNASVMSGFTGAGSIGFMLGPITSAFLLTLRPPQIDYPTAFMIICWFMAILEIVIVFFSIPFYKQLQRKYS